MKRSVLIIAVAACVLLGGCGLFEAEVTRPTEPSTAPVQQTPVTEPSTAPTTEPTTEPTTAPTTLPVEEGITEADIIGQWHIDSQYTVDESGVSPRDLYGTAISYGEGMTFDGDGTFTYYAGACYGEGRFSLNGSQIRVTLSKGDPTLENNVLVIREGDVLRIGLDQYGDGTLIWWVKQG